MNRSLKYIEQIIISLALVAVMGLMLIALPDTAYAEGVETVTVGSGETASDWLPHRTTFKYSRSQIIYDADDIGKDGAILSLAYQVAEASTGYRVSNMKIWMGYTDLDCFAYDKTGSAARSEYTLREPDVMLVYDGTLGIGEETGWQTIELDQPFDYDHSKGNLVIVTSVSTVQGEGAIKYFCTEYGNGFDHNNLTALEVDDDKDSSVTDPETYSGSNPWRIRSSRPNIQLTIDTSSGAQDATYDVTFDTDGGTPVPEVQSVGKGEQAVRPEDPKREGYRFKGWYKGDKAYSFDSRVYSSFTLKAEWIKQHTIKFVGWNDEELETAQVDDGQMPEFTGEDPTRPSEGDIVYVFAGWEPALAEAHADQTYNAVFINKADLADKTTLQASIKTATDARTGVRTSANGKDVGKNFKYVSDAQWTAYDNALKAAQAVADAPLATQEEVDKAVDDLDAAKTAFLEVRKDGTKVPPAITGIVISRNSGRQQLAVGGFYEWKVTFAEGTVLKNLAEGTITDDDFQIQRKPSGQDWKNSKCPYVGFTPSDEDGESNIGYLTGFAIPDNTKPTDTTNLWRFIYSGDSVECPVITQDGYNVSDKTILENAIKDAQDAQKDIKVSEDGWDIEPTELFVTPDELAALEAAIGAAQETLANDRATQEQINKAASDLAAATDEFINAKKAGNAMEEPEDDNSRGYQIIYDTEKVVLPDMPVREYTPGTGESGTYEWFTEKPLEFEFYDSTAQVSEGVYTTKEGTYSGDGDAKKVQMLSGVKLIRGHKYIVSVHETGYMIPAYYEVTIADDGAGNSTSYTANMANYYIRLNEDGAQPKDIKNNKTLKYFDVMKRDAELDDVLDARRVNVRIPVYYTKDGTNATILSGVAAATIKLTSPVETLYATSDSNGQISASLIEDMNYMVELIDDSGALGLDPFPLVVKDHAENGWPKSIYNHCTCASVQGLYLVDKKYEHTKDTTLVSVSGKTTVTGQNFQNETLTNANRYIINDRQLDNSTVTGLNGWDYEVFRVDAVNQFRNELSRLATGNFEITRKIPAGKSVVKVYYINKKGKLRSLKFTEEGGNVKYTMSSLSMYPNVIVYKSAAAGAPGDGTGSGLGASGSVTISKSIVTASTVKTAIKAAGGDEVKTIVLDKKVRKISKKAFKGTKVKTIIVKSKKLKKKTVKGSLKGSSVKTIKVKVGKAKTNKKYVKKYKKIFTKKNAGKKVKVKR